MIKLSLWCLLQTDDGTQGVNASSEAATTTTTAVPGGGRDGDGASVTNGVSIATTSTSLNQGTACGSACLPVHETTCIFSATPKHTLTHAQACTHLHMQLCVVCYRCQYFLNIKFKICNFDNSVESWNKNSNYFRNLFIFSVIGP